MDARRGGRPPPTGESSFAEARRWVPDARPRDTHILFCTHFFFAFSSVQVKILHIMGDNNQLSELQQLLSECEGIVGSDLTDAIKDRVAELRKQEGTWKEVPGVVKANKDLDNDDAVDNDEVDNKDEVGYYRELGLYDDGDDDGCDDDDDDFIDDDFDDDDFDDDFDDDCNELDDMVDEGKVDDGDDQDEEYALEAAINLAEKERKDIEKRRQAYRAGGSERIEQVKSEIKLCNDPVRSKVLTKLLAKLISDEDNEDEEMCSDDATSVESSTHPQALRGGGVESNDYIAFKESLQEEGLQLSDVIIMKALSDCCFDKEKARVLLQDDYREINDLMLAAENMPFTWKEVENFYFKFGRDADSAYNHMMDQHGVLVEDNEAQLNELSSKLSSRLCDLQISKNVGDSSSGGDQGSVEGVRDILGDQAAAPTPTGDVNEHEDAGESTVGKGARKKNTMISRASSAVSHLSRSLLGLPVNPFSRRETLVGNAASGKRKVIFESSDEDENTPNSPVKPKVYSIFNKRKKSTIKSSKSADAVSNRSRTPLSPSEDTCRPVRPAGAGLAAPAAAAAAASSPMQSEDEMMYCAKCNIVFFDSNEYYTHRPCNPSRGTKSDKSNRPTKPRGRSVEPRKDKDAQRQPRRKSAPPKQRPSKRSSSSSRAPRRGASVEENIKGLPAFAELRKIIAMFGDGNIVLPREEINDIFEGEAAPDLAKFKAGLETITTVMRGLQQCQVEGKESRLPLVNHILDMLKKVGQELEQGEVPPLYHLFNIFKCMNPPKRGNATMERGGHADQGYDFEDVATHMGAHAVTDGLAESGMNYMLNRATVPGTSLNRSSTCKLTACGNHCAEYTWEEALNMVNISLCVVWQLGAVTGCPNLFLNLGGGGCNKFFDVLEYAIALLPEHIRRLIFIAPEGVHVHLCQHWSWFMYPNASDQVEMVNRRLKPIFRVIDQFHNEIRNRSENLDYRKTPADGEPFQSAVDDNENGPFIQLYPTPKNGQDAVGQAVSGQGRKGGRTTLERHGVEHYEKIGRKGGRTILERHGVEHFANIGRKGGNAGELGYNERGYAIASIERALTGHGHDIDQLSDMTGRLREMASDAMHFLEGKTGLSMSRQGDVIVERLSRAVTHPATSIQVGVTAKDANYKPKNGFVFADNAGDRGILHCLLDPIDEQVVKTQLVAVIQVLSEQPLRTFSVCHESKGKVIDLGMARALVTKVMTRDQSKLTMNLYKCPKCGCLRWLQADVAGKARCLGLTTYGYEGEKMGCTQCSRNFVAQRVDWMAHARVLEEKGREHKK
mmetsp:Transcript_633/g.1408  ORF Transcript_633/g.1408 Transcript_633/m.1408 type:complete len:1292 (-) Transcript_633:48-3923(-)